MIRLLQYLIFGHVHEWEVHDEQELAKSQTHKITMQSRVTSIVKVTTLKCKKCGKLKHDVLEVEA